MTYKQKIIQILETNKGHYVSGQMMAKNLDISRNAVCKNIKSLKEQGYEICAIKNKGYKLLENNDILSAYGIKKYVGNDDLNIAIKDKVTSTNTLMRKIAIDGADEGYIITANEQTNGRGRFARDFYSPKNTGIYMSILLRPKGSLVSNITTMAATAVCEAIENVTGKKPMIKWVNDIYIDNKKVCGILTETSLSLESGVTEYAILGVGINVYANDFPAEIKNVAGAILESSESDIKNRLVAEFYNIFMSYYKLPNTDYIKKYINRSFIIGKNVLIYSKDTSKEALVLGIDDNCRLIVRYNDGREEALSSGEVSVRV